ncbi:MAG: urate hydroxylase PuuD [Pseudomonadota bacterium]
MSDEVLLWEWLEFAVRWLHVVTAIAWIGSSFYFIALDLGLIHRQHLPEGVKGEEWQVHGGGFYHIQKYTIAPDNLPEHLTWFKWESYSTWLSGFALLAIVYYAGAELYLIDPAKADLSIASAVLLSLGSLTIGWLAYNFLCRQMEGKSDTLLMVLLFVLIVIVSYTYDQIFSDRAALLHVGAFTATIMTANVFFIIMPNQRIVVADMKAGRVPDSIYGVIAKQRSTHNNYLTLPVVFLMLSVHYPLAFASEYNWLIAGLVFLMGVTIRHYFNTMHARKLAPNWTWLATAIIFIVIVWISGAEKTEPTEVASLPPKALAFSEKAQFDDAVAIVQGRCSMCHAREPFYDGIHVAPGGVYLETEADIALNAWPIYVQSGVTHAMPPANVSFITPEERRLLRAWFEG